MLCGFVVVAKPIETFQGAEHAVAGVADDAAEAVASRVSRWVKCRLGGAPLVEQLWERKRVETRTLSCAVRREGVDDGSELGAAGLVQ